MNNEEIKEFSKKILSEIKKETGLEIKGIITDQDFSQIIGRCCENILGYKQIPLGISNRSININGLKFWVPIATTEGALVASMCRGIKLLNLSGNLRGCCENLGITRSFTIKFPDFINAIGFYKWLKVKENIQLLKEEGQSTSRFLKIKSIRSKHVVGNQVLVKVYAYTGDAMGMNMITKACNQISQKIIILFPESKLACISSNICTDKKVSMENYCNGRGRRIFMNVILDNKDVKNVLKVEIDDLYSAYYAKIVIGSSMVMGGFNCQAANYVSAIFIALGQDPGQIIESSNCSIFMEKIGNDKMSVSLWMPSVVVGTIGGGTHLEPSRSFLKQFYVQDSDLLITDKELDKAIAPSYLALTVSSAIFAGELSLLGALANNTLMDAHLSLNRKN